MATIKDNKNVFKIVEKIPYGYKIWCYPTDQLVLDGCTHLPLYKDHPTKAHHVNTDTLVVVKSDGVRELISAAHCGGYTKQLMISRLNRLNKCKKTPSNMYKIETLKTALIYADALIWE